MNSIQLVMQDYLILAVYFVILLSLGYLFRGMSKNTRDYFAGSGSMLWWLVGATAFMNQFSAWTFTGAAGQAYTAGFQVALLFLGNAFGYFINYRYTAARMRQLNVVTGIEGVRKRYGRVNEQVFTWAAFPMRLIQAGTWLSALGVFMGAVFGWEPHVAVLICGVIVTTMTLVGGSWAVIASDYLQMLIVMSIAVITSVVITINSGGIGNIISSFPAASFVLGNGYPNSNWFMLWVIMTFIRQVFSTNNMVDSYRYLCAADSSNAKKGALLAGILMFVGSFIWFVPPWAAASMFPIEELKELYPNLRNAQEASYLVMVQKMMPAGMTGILIAGIFAATMSSMDTALNQNTGIFIRNFWKQVVRPDDTDEQLFRLSKIMTVVFGCCIVGVGLWINQLRHLTLFDIVLRISSLIALPMSIPLTIGIFYKRVPDWSAWATLIVGGFVSFFCGSWLTWGIEHFGLNLTTQEARDLVVTWATICHLTITMGFYFATTFFYKETGSERDKERDQVFADFHTPIVAGNADVEKFDYQRLILGYTSMGAGIIIAFVAFERSGFAARSIILLTAALLIGIGYVLRKSSNQKTISK